MMHAIYHRISATGPEIVGARTSVALDQEGGKSRARVRNRRDGASLACDRRHVVAGELEPRGMAFRLEIADFGAFYERTYPGAFRTALAIVRDATIAADVTQEAYVSAYAKRDAFRGDSPGHAWLHRIVVNQSLSALRRWRPVVREIEPAEAGRADDTLGSADRLALAAALGQLAPKQRAAVVLRYYHDYDYATIAQILGTTSTNVGALLSRALDRLRIELEPAETGVLAEAGR
jgi:RNA polymerase sigma factor (sigma-70 family)